MKYKMFIRILLITLSVVIAHSSVAGQLGPWNYTSSLNVARSANVAVLARDTIIYTFGDWPYSDTPLPVERTTIRPDGTLSPWVEESSQMVEARGFAVGFATDSYIYAIGGESESSISTTMERAPINPDGTLGAWTIIGVTTTMIGDQSALIQDNQYIYVIGGDQGIPSNFVRGGTNIYRTTINSDGSLGTWTQLSSHLVEGRYELTSILVNTTIYIVGGDITNVEVATLLPDGDFSSFTAISVTHTLHDGNGLFYDGTYLNVIGGYDGGDVNYLSERSIINPNGSLGIWEPLQTAIGEAGAPFIQTSKDAYMIAITDGGDSNSVEYAPLIPTGIEKRDWEIFE